MEDQDQYAPHIGLWRELWVCEEIVFTGSPPSFLALDRAAQSSLRKRLVYRITDFHPECLIAARDTHLGG